MKKLISLFFPLLLATCGASAPIWPVYARNVGQWADDTDLAIWFNSLKQPDHPTQSCCGPADAYWADSFEIDGDKYVAIITDDRDDAPLKRQHVPVGTKIVIPNYKLKVDQGNPTGHGVVFLGYGVNVYCYLPPQMS